MTDTTIIREALEASYETMWAYDGDGSSDARMKIGEALAAIARIENPWRDIKIEQPPEGSTFFARAENDYSGQKIHVVGRFLSDGFYLEDGSEMSFNWTITHWQPLPQPPKDQRDE